MKTISQIKPNYGEKVNIKDVVGQKLNDEEKKERIKYLEKLIEMDKEIRARILRQQGDYGVSL